VGSSLVHFMEFWSQRSVSGTEGAPSLATPAKGERILEATIDRLIEFGKWWQALEFPPRVDLRAKRGYVYPSAEREAR
jgi:creatinine amidohydrolase/Fe(II)-dependent formamide hydrolase-like protein